MNIGIELKIEDALQYTKFVTFSPDMFENKEKGVKIDLLTIIATDEEGEGVSIDKNQLSVLINYLKQIYNQMR